MAKLDKENRVKVPFFKKWWVMLILGFVIGAVAFSGGGTEEEASITDEKPVTSTESGSTEVSAEATEEAKEEPAKDPVKVWENDKMIISFKDVTDEGVRFLAENLTDKELTVQADSIAINGFSSNDITMSDAVAPKSKGYVLVQTSELADAGDPTTLSGKLRIIDFTGSWDTFEATFTEVPLNQ